MAERTGGGPTGQGPVERGGAELADPGIGARDWNTAGVERRRVRPEEQAGQPGTAVYGGYIVQHEDTPQLLGRERYRTFSQLLANTPIVAAGVRLYGALVTGAVWHVQPAEADTDHAYAELAEQALMADPAQSWVRIIRRAAMYRLYGFSIQEWTARRTDAGHLTLGHVEPRPQVTIERWDLDVAASTPLAGVVQRSEQDGREIYIPRWKLLYLCDDALSDSPEGLGLLRHCVAAAWRLGRYYQLEGWGYESDVRGIPVARAPLQELAGTGPGAYGPDASDGVAHLRRFLADHVRTPRLGILLDSDTYRQPDTSPSSVAKWGVDLLSSGGQSAGPALGAAIDRTTAEIARILGVDGLLLGTVGSGGGAYALARDKTATLHLQVDAALAEVREGVQRDLLGSIWRLNGWPPEMMPELRVEAVRQRDVEQTARALSDLATAGAILDPDDPAIDDVRVMAGLSPRPETAAGAAGLMESE